MRPIPKKLRDEISSDPYYKKCCITGKTSERIEWHHNLIYAGNQRNEKWCILPLAESVHENITKYKEICDWIMLNRASELEIQQVSKAINYTRMREILNKKYGKYKH